MRSKQIWEAETLNAFIIYAQIIQDNLLNSLKTITAMPNSFHIIKNGHINFWVKYCL